MTPARRQGSEQHRMGVGIVTRMTPQPLRSRPTVSVVIPCYNYARYLPECVRTVMDQTEVDLDVIIVDDASTDGSAEIADGLAAAHPNVRVIVHQQNMRHIATFNEGILAAKGSYVLLLSADDLLTAGALGRAVALMEHHPEVGMVYGHAPAFSGTVPAPRGPMRSWSVWTGRDWLALLCKPGRNPVATPAAVMRTSLIHELGGYDARLPHTSDLDMWLRSAGRASIGRINGVDQAFYRVHETNMHRVDYAGAATDIVERERAFQLFLTDADIPGAADLLSAARASMAVEMVGHARAAAQSDPEAAQVLLGLAREMSPGVTRSRAWRRYELTCEQSGGQAKAAVLRIGDLVHAVGDKYQWVKYRREGHFR
jgi:Glycosyl transferase family 2